MKLQSGYPYSLIKYGLPFDYPKLEENIRTDVVIMGGGISGALVAYYLIKNGINSILIDKRSIGLGSTCASTTLLQYEIDKPLFELIKQIGEYNAVRAYTLCSEAIDKLKAIAEEIGFPQFEYKKSLYFAEKEKHRNYLNSEFESRKNNGFKVEWLEKRDIENQFGFSSPCAILSEQGAETNAYLLTHHILQYSMRAGLKVFDRTNATNIVHDKDAVILKTDNGYIINARKIVYATGYEVTDFINKNIVRLHSTYVTISEPQQSIADKQIKTLLWNTGEPYLYMRSTPDGRIILGGRDEKFYDADRRDKLIDKKSIQLFQDFRKLFPGTPFKSEFSWAGTFGITKDGLPYIGEYKKMPNSYFALGFGGNGITFSQLASEIILNLYCGKPDKDKEIFSFERK